MAILDKKFQYYPTPPELVDEIVQPYLAQFQSQNVRILEPSAGEGSILESITDFDPATKQHHGVHPNSVTAVELQPELASVLRAKGYPTYEADFLTWTTIKRFTHIFMNPPFKDGARHVLHAYRFLDSGGSLVAIINANTLHNVGNNAHRQQLSKVIQESGSVEFFEHRFTSAQRTTDVEIAIVTLTREKATDRFEFDFSEGQTSDNGFSWQEAINSPNLPATADLMGNAQISYEQAQETVLEYLQAKKKLNHFINMTTLSYEQRPVMEALESSVYTYEERYQNFQRLFKLAAWSYIIDRSQIGDLINSKLQKEFQEHLEQNAKANAFTKANMQCLFASLYERRQEIVKETIVHAHDVCRTYHKDNSEHWEGWKTNDAYRVRMKFIIPGCVTFREESYYRTFEHIYDRERWTAGFMRDLDMALSFINGDKPGKYLSCIDALNQQFKKIGKVEKGQKFENWVESEYFKLKLHLKGTVHFHFKDKKLWEQFNIQAAKGKNWLPG